MRMERETGIEPATSSLGSSRSTAELLPLSLVILANLALSVACRNPEPPPAPIDRVAVHRDLHTELTPVKLANCEFERVGDKHDGGYVICKNLLAEAEAIYSYGISASVEAQVARNGDHPSSPHPTRSSNPSISSAWSSTASKNRNTSRWFASCGSTST
jgi:hypothetical protein